MVITGHLIDRLLYRDIERILYSSIAAYIVSIITKYRLLTKLKI